MGELLEVDNDHEPLTRRQVGALAGALAVLAVLAVVALVVVVVAGVQVVTIVAPTIAAASLPSEEVASSWRSDVRRGALVPVR